MEEVVPAENGEAAPFISAVMEESGDTWRAVCTAVWMGRGQSTLIFTPL